VDRILRQQDISLASGEISRTHGEAGQGRNSMVMNGRRFRNRLLAKLLTRFPSLAQRLLARHGAWDSDGPVPWAPVAKPLSESVVALVTTAGVHHRDQPPFDMVDPQGDPAFRVIDATRPVSDLTITHDYYDHADADRDINVVFPVDRLRELSQDGVIGGLARHHYGFMGHIEGPHIRRLLSETAPEAARRLKAEGVDVALLTPG